MANSLRVVGVVGTVSNESPCRLVNDPFSGLLSNNAPPESTRRKDTTPSAGALNRITNWATPSAATPLLVMTALLVNAELLGSEIMEVPESRLGLLLIGSSR